MYYLYDTPILAITEWIRKEMVLYLVKEIEGRSESLSLKQPAGTLWKRFFFLFFSVTYTFLLKLKFKGPPFTDVFHTHIENYLKMWIQFWVDLIQPAQKRIWLALFTAALCWDNLIIKVHCFSFCGFALNWWCAEEERWRRCQGTSGIENQKEKKCSSEASWMPEQHYRKFCVCGWICLIWS